MDRYIKKLLIIGAVIGVNLLFFQNCSKGSFTQQSSLANNETVSIADTTIKPNGGESLYCPIYNRPLCQSGEILSTVKSTDGCLHPTCIKNPNPTCPIYAAPLCTKNEVVVNNIDKTSGCSYPVCEVKKECPLVMPPLCEGGELVDIKSEDGCSQIVCKPKEKFLCPLYMAPLCSKNEVLKSKIDKNGCSVPSCEPVVQCPQYMPPLCDDGQLVKKHDMNGCTQVVCVHNPNPTCPQYAKPLCAQNAVVNIVEDENSKCPVPVCNEITGDPTNPVGRPLQIDPTPQ